MCDPASTPAPGSAEANGRGGEPGLARGRDCVLATRAKVGSSFIDVLQKFEADPETEYVVMVGEIGGDEEEKAARFIQESMSKPVLAYIAGFTAPPGKTMGHAGAIISGSSGTAQAKKETLEACGVRVGTTPTEVAQLVAEVAHG